MFCVFTGASLFVLGLVNTHQFNSHSLLQQLHWLPVEYRISFNVANITFNTFHYSQLAYLHSLPCFHTPVRSLKSSSTNLLTVPLTCTALGTHSFSVASPKSLFPAVHFCNCPDTFHHHLKTNCVQQAFSSS